MPQDVAILGGTVVIIAASDMQGEAEALAKMLQENNVKTTSMRDIANAILIPGRPYMRIYEDIVMQAKHFLVVVSAGLREDNKLKELVYTALGIASDEKRVIPIKFSPENSRMPFLENLSPVRFYTGMEGAEKERYIRLQVSRLLEVL